MHPPAVIFCERSGDWAAAWRRAALARLGPSALRWLPIVETRGVALCREAQQTAPAAFLALELTGPSLDRTLDFLAGLTSQRLPARAAVLLARDAAAYEDLARELGAVLVVSSPRNIESLLPVVQRHVAERLGEPLPILERIWDDLPWEGARRRATIQTDERTV